MDKEQVLAEYKHEIENLRKMGKIWNITENEMNKIILESLNDIKKENKHSLVSLFIKCIKYLIISFLFIILLLFIISLILFNNSNIFHFIVRNIQDYIYPTMKLLRLLTLPFIQTFPSLTVLYDEVCLVENPYFEPGQVECWPCNHIQSILTLPKFKEEPLNQWAALPHSYYPFVVKNYSSIVTFKDLRKLHEENEDLFKRDAPRFSSNINSWKTLNELFEKNLEDSPTALVNGHVTWRVNRLAPARVLRSLFPRPKFVADSVHIERYVLIDEPHSPAYSLPFPEGYRVFLMQTSGQRLIALHPVTACLDQCHRVSIVLEPGDVLVYNSWLYRPIISYPTHSNHLSIGYLGSADLPP